MVQRLRLCASTAGHIDSIPGQGRKIPHVVKHGKKKERERQPLLIQSPYNKQNLSEIRETKWLVPGQHMICVK